MHPIRPLRVRALAAIGRREFRNTRVLPQWPWEQSVDLRNLRAPRTSFRHATFERAVFDGAHLVDTDFTHAVLNQARFDDAELTRACFDRAELAEADFRFSTLRGALFNGARLTNARLHGDASAARFRNARLSRARLSGATLVSADFQHADLTDAHLLDTDLRGSDLRNAVLIRADLTHAFLGRADLRAADLRRTHLAGADLEHADLCGADLSSAYLVGARLTSTLGDGSPAFDRHTKWPLYPALTEGTMIDDRPYDEFMTALRTLGSQRLSAAECVALRTIAATRPTPSSDSLQR